VSRIRRVVSKTLLILVFALLAGVWTTGSGSKAFAASSLGVLPAMVKPAWGLTPVAVFGDDQRREVPEELAHLAGKIGMLYELQTQTLCTAFCVAPNTIATAAHCLFQPRDGRLPNLSAITFRLDYNGLLLTSGIEGRRTGYPNHNISVGITEFTTEPPLSAPQDWALVKLERPICRFGVLAAIALSTTDLIEAARRRLIFQLSYHWDYERWQLAYSSRCAIERSFNGLEWHEIKRHFTDPESLVLHNCDTGAASSGSPILMDTSAGPVVVGLNVGTFSPTRLVLHKGSVVRRLKEDVVANTAVNATAFAGIIPSLAEGEMVQSSAEILEMQHYLRIAGLYAGALDGVFGRATRAAIQTYERLSHGLSTGLPSRAVLARLQREFAEQDTVQSAVEDRHEP
jgi:hypothetical protein